jgi:hypothetical protein
MVRLTPNGDMGNVVGGKFDGVGHGLLGMVLFAVLPMFK